MSQTPAGYPTVDERISVRAREYFDLIADGAYKDAIIEVLQGKLDSMAAQLERLTGEPRQIGFAAEELG